MCVWAVSYKHNIFFHVMAPGPFIFCLLKEITRISSNYFMQDFIFLDHVSLFCQLPLVRKNALQRDVTFSNLTTQAFHFSGDTKFHVFSSYSLVNLMKSQVNLAWNQCLF